MSVVGRVDGLWRYPVKSMRGEELEEAFVGFSGIYGDRVFAFLSSASSKGFPYLTAREQKEMLRYRPRFRNAKSAARPVNLVEAMSIEPGVTPLYADPAGVVVDVETPKGEELSINDPALIRMLSEGMGSEHELTLRRSVGSSCATPAVVVASSSALGGSGRSGLSCYARKRPPDRSGRIREVQRIGFTQPASVDCETRNLGAKAEHRTS